MVDCSAHDTTIISSGCDSLTLGGTTFYTSTIFNDTILLMGVCDSIITYEVVVHESVETMMDTVFAYNSISINGTNYTSTQDITDTLSTINGCDSIVKVPVKIIPITEGTLLTYQSFENHENGWSFSVDPDEYSFSSSHWDTAYSLGSIDDASFGNEFWGMRDVDNEYHDLDFDAIDISGQNAVVLSFDYYSDGYDATDYIKYGIEYDNGTSFSNLTNLNKNTDEWITVTDTIPAGSSFVRLRLTAKQNGGTDYAGFDNIKLVGYSCFPETTRDTISGCTSVEFNGNTYTASENLIDSLTNSTGCDSLAITSIIVNPSYNFVTPAISDIDSVMLNGTTYTTSQNVNLALTTVNGCDSLVEVPITILNSADIDTVAFQSFEENENGWGFTLNQPTYNVSNNDIWDTVQSISAIDTSTNGTMFWGMRDLTNNVNPSDPDLHTINFESIDVSTYSYLSLSFDYYSNSNDNNPLEYSVESDNGSTWNVSSDLTDDSDEWITKKY